MRIFLFVLLTAFVFCNSPSCLAQNNFYIGANANVEFFGNANPRLGAGVTLEKKFAEHHGFESGIFYRNIILPATTTIKDNMGTIIESFNSACFESYISIPIQYKFYSKKINFSLGFNFDYLVGYSFSPTAPDYESTFHYSVDGYWKNGVSVKVGKSYSISSAFILEPEIRFNMIASEEPHILYAGAGLIGKFDLSYFLDKKAAQ